MEEKSEMTKGEKKLLIAVISLGIVVIGLFVLQLVNVLSFGISVAIIMFTLVAMNFICALSLRIENKKLASAFFYYTILLFLLFIILLLYLILV